MRRMWHTVRQSELDGSDRSQQLALAIAQIADPDTLEAILQTLTLLDRIGGQVHVAAYRTKYKPEIVNDGNGGAYQRLVPVKDVKEPGRYETDGFLFLYEHIAKLPRQDAEPDADPAEPLPSPVEFELDATEK